jgi:hypothetical protein
MYYLQRARFAEAMQLNRQLSSQPGGRAPAPGSTTTTRAAIMARYSSILPGLAAGGGHRVSLAGSLGPRPERPVPLSVTLQVQHCSSFMLFLHAHAQAQSHAH